MRAEWEAAAAWREQWAQECGFNSFQDAMKFGLVAAGKRHPAYLAKVAAQAVPRETLPETKSTAGEPSGEAQQTVG